MWLLMNDLDRRWSGTIVMFVALICSGSMYIDWVDHSICYVSIVSNGFRIRVDIPPARQSPVFRNQGVKAGRG